MSFVFTKECFDPTIFGNKTLGGKKCCPLHFANGLHTTAFIVRKICYKICNF